MASTRATPTFLFPSMETAKRPKSPKSPKNTLENPLLKNPQFLLGAPSPSWIPEPQAPQPRSPLLPLPMNQSRGAKTPQATPGPPPKASLSLMGMMPMEPTTITSPTAPPQPMMTPPPVASPPFLLHHETTMTPRPPATDECNNWIVAYGYTNRDEYQELVKILSDYGPVLQQQSNGNWLAIQYHCRLSAEKSLCSQPIRLSTSHSLCGTVRGSPQLLQGLLAQPPTAMDHSKSLLMTTSARSTSNVASQQQQLQEKDILAHYSDEDQYLRNPTSVCEKMFAWYFGWSYEQQHPHSD